MDDPVGRDPFGLRRPPDADAGTATIPPFPGNADDRFDRLLARATANGWIEELEHDAADGHHVLTDEGERALARYEQRQAARGMRRQAT